MPDRLRQLLDLVVAADPGTEGAALATGASFSRDHLDRLLTAATGETPAALRRRLLLERAAWRLARGAPGAQAGTEAGYGSAAAFSRAFARAYGAPPSRHDGEWILPAPNGIHFHPPGGVLLPAVGPAGTGPSRMPAAATAAHPDPATLMLAHHLDHAARLVAAAESLPTEALRRPLRPGLVVVWFEGEETSAGEMARRLVGTVEVWAAAIAGKPAPELAGPLGPRLDRAGRALARQVHRIAAHGAWDDGFVDALCEPPQAFTFRAVLAHVLEYGAVRRAALAGVLDELGAGLDPQAADAILWDLRRRRTR